MARLLSLWLPTLPTDRLRRHGAPEGPLATIEPLKGAQRIAAVDTAAAAAAIRPGMTLADARAICPALATVTADPDQEAKALRAIGDWGLRFTPITALDPPDGVLLDITGVTHLFGGEAALLDTLTADLAARGFAGRAAIGDTIEAAWALARFGTIRIAPPGRAAITALSRSLPLAALRLPSPVLQALAQAGLREIGDLLTRPRAPLAARFGATLLERLDGLIGLHKSPLTPSTPVPLFLAERRFAHPIATVEAIEASLLSLARHLAAQLERQAQGARRVEAVFFRVDGVVKRLALGTSRPLRDPVALVRLFHEKLESLGEEGLDTGYGFDVIRLGASVAEPLTSAQAELAAAAEQAAEADLALLIDRLGARLGATRVVRLRNADHHRPEEAAIAWPAHRLSTGPSMPDEPGRLRPLKMFDRPEPIDATAGVPDGPPLYFRWRRTLHLIAAVEGPERIAAPWWTTAAPTRDYFQAEDVAGHRFWLFREGLYGIEAARPRWFLHGLFG
ncbi:Y-family DNA polymerase [Lichenifustis flavocetrariae]|uniref:DNA-directed DNA polymerase n=1 Tax=Lichenifustis flavocetrariae TaxID=2949735 RepID=A0AA41Z206_9HYPH|nr:DNA polymerase Y family protein [Lichenifustis flavocetrariae]MCW6508905.1 DNA polymerase Y family protein [Lichenifustis flavocetrariae]